MVEIVFNFKCDLDVIITYWGLIPYANDHMCSFSTGKYNSILFFQALQIVLSSWRFTCIVSATAMHTKYI